MPCLDRNWTGVGGQIYVAFYTVLCVLVLINTLGTLVIVRKEDRGGEYFVVLFQEEKMQFVNRLHYVHLEWKSITNTFIFWVDGTCKF